MTYLNGFMHGINLGGWLSQCDNTKEHYDTFITEDDLKKISSWGLDHVRLPVDYLLVENDDKTYREDGFIYIQNCIDWCKKYNLNMILDLHKTLGFFFDADAKETGFFESADLQEHFYLLWEEFTKRFAKYEDMLCFELLNEVTDKKYSDTWNRIIKTCICRIRKIAPTVRILTGGYWNNSADAIRDLDKPYDDNVIYTFHFYEPLVWTHQAAPWLGKMDTKLHLTIKNTYGDIAKATKENIGEANQRYLEFDQNETLSPAYFEKVMDNMLAVAKERNAVLYCGEYGVINYADAKDALEWYKMITSVLDKYKIGRAAWTYKNMNFGIADEWMDKVREELVRVM